MLYFSSLLQTIPKYKPTSDNLFAALDTCGIPYGLLEGTRDIWLRDFMPVQRGDGKYVSFRYEPSYLTGYPQLRSDFRRNIRKQFLHFAPKYSNVLCSSIDLDGGNVVFSPSKEKAVISDRIFSENPKWERNALVRALEEQLEAQVIIIPSLSSDLTGHADGMVRFIDEDRVIGNTTPYKNGLEQRIKAVLGREGLQMVDFPYYTSPGKSAAGCYLNFLETKKFIFLPVFGSNMDNSAIETSKRIFTKNIVPVRIDEIAADGGCLSCISWEINKEEKVENSMDDPE